MATKKTAARKAPELKVFDRDSVDRISRYLKKKNLVPPAFRGSEKYVDIISWNLRWFDHRSPERIQAISEIMRELNADIFVLLEIAEDGALEQVIQSLEKTRAGYYSVHYGNTGGQQRIALMWNREWIRTKRDVEELFADEGLTVTGEDGHKADAFPRLPLWAYFEARAADPRSTLPAFNFELAGLHLKSQMAPRGVKVERGGIRQRTTAAKRLAKWLSSAGEHYDEDIILAGDWNAKPEEPEWDAFRKMERNQEIAFTGINSKTGSVTHLARFNQSGAAGTRLDLQLINRAAQDAAVKGNQGVVVEWSLFEDLGVLDTAVRKKLFATFTHLISDHLPVLSRFYTVDRDSA